jgi:hypothetical protein
MQEMQLHYDVDGKMTDRQTVESPDSDDFGGRLETLNFRDYLCKYSGNKLGRRPVLRRRQRVHEGRV